MIPQIPWWRPDRFAERRENLMRRARIVQATRAWFDQAGFVEVTTPALQVSPGLEPHLSAFETSLAAPEGALGPRFLHTSPEFAMKKLLVAGIERPYQLAPVFRNGERSATHHPEFTMLEWYRAQAGYEHLIEDCEALLRAALRASDRPAFTRGDLSSAPWEPFERLTVAGAFQRYCGIDLLATAPDPTIPDLALLAAASAPLGIHPHDGDRWDDLFFRIMLERIEPLLGMGRPTVLLEYPVSMAALARAKPDDPRVAERFELYVCGVELANAFGELTDPVIQRARFEADAALKQRLYGRRYPIDEDFLAALDHGLPDSAGIALGFDRLVMLATGADRIDDILWAPVV